MPGFIVARIQGDGSLVLPLELRQRLGMVDGALVRLEVIDGGILVRPAEDRIEIYTPERKAEFLLSNAVDADDYAAAAIEVRRMGLDPDEIPHFRSDRG